MDSEPTPPCRRARRRRPGNSWEFHFSFLLDMGWEGIRTPHPSPPPPPHCPLPSHSHRCHCRITHTHTHTATPAGAIGCRPTESSIEVEIGTSKLPAASRLAVWGAREGDWRVPGSPLEPTELHLCVLLVHKSLLRASRCCSPQGPQIGSTRLQGWSWGSGWREF